MRIHILGICGTFMGGLAMLARSLGHEVTGSDDNVYPPMSTLLQEQGIGLIQGYDPAPDWVIIGNAMMRGNPCVERYWNAVSLMSPARSGCTITCWRSVRLSPSPAPTAKPPPPAWWPGSWRSAVTNLIS